LEVGGKPRVANRVDGADEIVVGDREGGHRLVERARELDLRHILVLQGIAGELGVTIINPWHVSTP
jgi:hypothetical protein